MWKLRRRRFVNSALAAMIGFALIGAIPGGGSTAVAKGVPLTLYLSAFGGSELVPLDPLTLADQPNEGPLEFNYSNPSWAVSEDGSTLAVAEYQVVYPGIVHIKDAVTGAERTSFELPETAWVRWLTVDGSLLIAQSIQSGAVTGTSLPDWYVFSTADGSVVSKIYGKGQGINWTGFYDALFDPAVKRLYLPFVPEDGLSDGPSPLHIAGYDILTEQETGRIELPGVLVGSWIPPDQSEQSELGIVSQILMPGIAISPDGSQLAVVDPVTKKITLINPWIMQIDKVLTPTRDGGWRERLANLLFPMPSTAEAKLYSGTVLGAYYSSDGSSLYVTGRCAGVDATTDEIEVDLLGIQRIDLRTGEIDAESLDGVDVINVWVTWVANGGGAIYVYTYDEPWETATNGSVETHVRRLDPSTLEVRADRELSRQEWVSAATMIAT